jgi:5-methylcytosine-specific restriction endonuclease McrA
MKEEILKLRSEGKTFNEIKTILNCSKSTISYYCSDGQKEKTIKRTKKRRENLILSKLEKFKSRKIKNTKESVRKFQKRDNDIKKRGKVNNNLNTTFSWTDVIEKFGENTNCYLSGEKINLYEKGYSFDHIIPVSLGGDNSLDNLGVSNEKVNRMKTDMIPDEFINWCRKILEFNGYKVEKFN